MPAIAVKVFTWILSPGHCRWRYLGFVQLLSFYSFVFVFSPDYDSRFIAKESQVWRGSGAWILHCFPVFGFVCFTFPHRIQQYNKLVVTHSSSDNLGRQNVHWVMHAFLWYLTGSNVNSCQSINLPSMYHDAFKRNTVLGESALLEWSLFAANDLICKNAFNFALLMLCHLWHGFFTIPWPFYILYSAVAQISNILSQNLEDADLAKSTV